VRGYAPELLRRGYQVNLHEVDALGKSITGDIVYIKATASPKNVYSCNILEDVGFRIATYDKETDRFDYRISMADIMGKA